MMYLSIQFSRGNSKLHAVTKVQCSMIVLSAIKTDTTLLEYSSSKSSNKQKFENEDLPQSLNGVSLIFKSHMFAI